MSVLGILLALLSPRGDGAPLAPPPVFRALSLEQGLSQAVVRAIAQDRRGFLWVVTEDGLNRYDGYGFTVFRNDPLDPDSLSDNGVLSIAPGTGAAVAGLRGTTRDELGALVLGDVITRAGEKVVRGEVVATVGSSGHSTAPHLHYEVLRHGELGNPTQYILSDEFVVD